MKIINGIRPRGRSPQNPDTVPMKDITQLKLKDRLSGAGQGLNSRVCLHELALVFSCFKKNNFKEQLCEKELTNFQRCFDLHNNSNAHGAESKSKKGVSTPEVNALLKRFPNK